MNSPSTPPPVPATQPVPVQTVVHARPRGRGCLLASISLIILMLGVVGCVFLLGLALRGMGGDLGSHLPPRVPPRYAETLVEGELTLRQRPESKVVVIPVSGVISNSAPGGLFGSVGESMVERVQRQLSQAVGDEEVAAIVLHINSPGGEVTASDHLYQAVMAARAVKPVVAYFDSVAASGGYYLACGANHIVAQETGITGSIGVIIQSVNYAELFEKVGLETMTFTSGGFKDTLSGARPMRPDEEIYVQRLVSTMYDRFVSLVAQGRDIPEARLRQGIADGRIFTGIEAVDVGLVDETGPLATAYAKARELAEAPEAVVVRYGPSAGGLARLLETAGQEALPSSRKIEVELGGSMLPKLRPGIPYYLAPGMVGWE